MKYAILATALLSQAAHAFLPAPGLWATDNIDGQGFNVETQNNIMIVTSYVFDSAGHQVWYLSAGPYNETTQTFAATFANATGGSCLSCSYVAPAKNAAAGGNMQITFTSRETGTIYFNGGSRSIHHLNFGYTNGNLGYFDGEWQFSFQIGTLVDGSWIVFPGTRYTASDGTVYASGYQDGKSATTVALGIYSAAADQYIVAFNDGAGYTRTFQFKGDQQRMLGLAWFQPDGQSISGSGSVASGSRLLTLSELQGGGNPLAAPGGDLEALAEAIRNANN